jgi:hypothetical protein
LILSIPEHHEKITGVQPCSPKAFRPASEKRGLALADTLFIEFKKTPFFAHVAVLHQKFAAGD